MKKFFNVKTISLILAVILLVGGAVGGTLAWIIDTKTVTNTFTYGDINIDLEETDTKLDDDDKATTNDYKMIPGQEITKDPLVTVKANSEACWLFVKLDKAGGATIGETTYDFDDYLTYNMADGWTELDDGVYYRDVKTSNKDQEFSVIKDNKVTVSGSVTKAMLNALDATAGSETYPTLEVTAYAIQRVGFDTAAVAWAEASK